MAAALQPQLRDPNKFIRQAVLNALARLEGNVDVGLLCEVLRDPDVETQQKAIDAVVRANHPDTIQHLVKVLRDEDEGARRAAVEVLNEIGTPQHVKYLLQSIKDDDWWVRSRAADALAKIGGPRVIDAALELIRDQDEEVRRAAIEILNQTKDERAVGFLIEATKDNDWWVRERAVDALAEIGSKRALPALSSCCASATTRSLPTVVRALGKLGDTTADREAAAAARPRQSKEVRLEAITALTRLVDDERVDVVRARLEFLGSAASDPTVSHAALQRGRRPRRALLERRRSPCAQRRRAHGRAVAHAAGRSPAISDGLMRAEPRRAAARHLDAEAGRRARGPLQVHRRRSARARSAPCC